MTVVTDWQREHATRGMMHLPLEENAGFLICGDCEHGEHVGRGLPNVRCKPAKAAAKDQGKPRPPAFSRYTPGCKYFEKREAT